VVLHDLGNCLSENDAGYQALPALADSESISVPGPDLECSAGQDGRAHRWNQAEYNGRAVTTETMTRGTLCVG
jgi:hypothetical protein